MPAACPEIYDLAGRFTGEIIESLTAADNTYVKDSYSEIHSLDLSFLTALPCSAIDKVLSNPLAM